MLEIVLKFIQSSKLTLFAIPKCRPSTSKALQTGLICPSLPEDRHLPISLSVAVDWRLKTIAPNDM